MRPAKREFRHGNFRCNGCAGGYVAAFARLIFLVLLVVFVRDCFAVGTVQMSAVNAWRCVGSGGRVNIAPTLSGACSPLLPGSVVVSAGAYDERRISYYLGACTVAADGKTGGCLYRARTVYPNCGPCNGGADADTAAGGLSATLIVQTLCPENSSPLQGTKCSCNDGYNSSSGNQCVPYACPPSGSYSAVTQPDQKVVNAGDGVCAGGCSYVPSSWKVGQDGQIWATWPFKSTGSYCRGKVDAVSGGYSGEENSSNPAPVPCGANQCPGSVNGATVCVPCKKQQEQGPSTAASGPSVSASGPAGSSTVTDCNGVTCTTTTTTKDASGNVIGTAEKTEKQESFCKDNPQSALCKQSQFAGACSATSCDGDAVQCAIARETYKRNCEWFEDPATQPFKSAGNSAMNGQAQPEGHPGASSETKDIAFSSAIDQTDAIGGASCPADRSVAMGPATLVIPFSKLCSPLQMLGKILVALAMLASLVIVFHRS